MRAAEVLEWLEMTKNEQNAGKGSTYQGQNGMGTDRGRPVETKDAYGFRQNESE